MNDFVEALTVLEFFKASARELVTRWPNLVSREELHETLDAALGNQTFFERYRSEWGNG